MGMVKQARLPPGSLASSSMNSLRGSVPRGGGRGAEPPRTAQLSSAVCRTPLGGQLPHGTVAPSSCALLRAAGQTLVTRAAATAAHAAGALGGPPPAAQVLDHAQLKEEALIFEGQQACLLVAQVQVQQQGDQPGQLARDVGIPAAQQLHQRLPVASAAGAGWVGQQGREAGVVQQQHVWGGAWRGQVLHHLCRASKAVGQLAAALQEVAAWWRLGLLCCAHEGTGGQHGQPECRCMRDPAHLPVQVPAAERHAQRVTPAVGSQQHARYAGSSGGSELRCLRRRDHCRG